MIVVVLDNDLLRFINHNKFGISIKVGTELDWLVDEYHMIVEKRLSQPPVRCKKLSFTHIIWFGLPINENFVDNVLRVRFNHCLENVVTKYIS